MHLPSIEPFIPTELTIAPDTLWQTCNLKLKSIPIDAQTAFEFWSPIVDATLLPNEAALLRRDYQRLAGICAQLTWLLGGVYASNIDHSSSRSSYDWQEIVQPLYQSGVKPDGIEVTYHPPQVGLSYSPNASNLGWIIEPAHWQIYFYELLPFCGGFRAERLNFTVQIFLGQAITRPLNSASSSY